MGLSVHVPCFLPELLDRPGGELGKSGMGVGKRKDRKGRRKVKGEERTRERLGDSEGDPAWRGAQQSAPGRRFAPCPSLLSPPLPSASFPPPVFAPHCPSLAKNPSRPPHLRSVSHALLFSHKKPLPLVSPLPPVAPPGVPPCELCRQEGTEGKTVAQRLQADWELKEGMQLSPWAWGRRQQVKAGDPS